MTKQPNLSTVTAQVTPTKVTFTQAIHQLTAKVQIYQHLGDTTLLVTDVTPFHPVSHIWPDQPADKGTVTFDGQSIDVIDCLIGAWDCDNQQLYAGKDIPIKRDEPGWYFVVVHQLAGNISLDTDKEVELNVDADYQQSLSRPHSGAHLSALALNKVLQQRFWRKEAGRLDALGQYDFHSYAEQTSFVTPHACIDTYRMGKTLKKRGFNNDDFVAALAEVKAAVNTQLNDWLAINEAITMHREGDALTDSRYWQTQLDGKRISIPCGGTHVSHMSELKGLQIELKRNDDGDVEMITRV
ncbi:MAG: alanyl-tRNA editing protein [Shewanella sp.]|nr:alanyl-tRNA editing protein [Shewanella sp.]MCF1432051.1 alanyl-tRNA editing protein [Shewanella sp.]MCF1438887.1 alanyl-tRNA editing protein [Shewanella sp.]MCF1459248.1 alanyl-tRNA editing protein [Shewanella sp.]